MTQPENGAEQQVIVIGPDGQPVGMAQMPQSDGEGGGIGGMVEQPAKVMRIGTMIKQLLEEVRAGLSMPAAEAASLLSMKREK